MAEDVKVPEGWRKIPLLEKLAFIKGKAPRKFYNFKEKNTIRYLTPECLRGRNNETLYCNIYEAEIVNDDVVVLWDGSNAGEIFFAKDGAIASTMAKIEIDEKSHKRFFYYYLKLYEPILKYQIKGSGIPHVEKDIFGLLPNTFPSLPEQHKIAEILETVDNAIEKTGRIIEKYKRIKQGLMQDLLTRGIAESDELGVRSYELRDEKKHRFKDSPLGRIPEEWEVVEFKDICKVRQGLQIAIANRFKEPGPKRYIYITIQYLNSNDKDEDAEYIQNPPKSVICGKDDLLMSRTGNTGMVITGVEGVFHNNFFLVDYDKKEVDKMYLFYYLNLPWIQEEIRALAGSTTIPDLNHNDFYSLKFLKPPLPEQKRIASILSQIDEAIEKEQKYKEKLERIKKGLMEDLLTGKVRVLGVMNYELGVRS